MITSKCLKIWIPHYGINTVIDWTLLIDLFSRGVACCTRGSSAWLGFTAWAHSEISQAERQILNSQSIHFHILLKIKKQATDIFWYNEEQTSSHVHAPRALTPTCQLSISCARAEADMMNIEQLRHNGRNRLNWMLVSPCSEGDGFLAH